VKWAERKEKVLLTVDLIDVTAAEAKVTLEPSGKLTFEWRNYAVEMELLKEVDVEKSKWGFDARAVHFSIAKKTPEYWNKLLKSGKPKWLSVDWARWKDEDEEEEPAAPDFADLGGGNGFDFNAMQGMGGEGHDSDDEDMPDLEGDTAGAPAPATATEAPAEAPAATAPAATTDAPATAPATEEEDKKGKKPAEETH